MTDTTDRVWANPHDDAPTNDDGVPIHPEKGYPICGYEKTDAVDENKRDDIPYCLQAAGWGTDRQTGHCKNHGGAGGAPTGWANGNARHLMFSKRMTDDDRDQFQELVDVGDGDKIPVEEFRATLGNIIAFEEMRFTRALDKHPDVEQIGVYECPSCGKGYRRTIAADTEPTVNECTGTQQIDESTYVPCDYTGPLDKVPGKSWVEFGDESVERKASHIARLIRIYDQVSGPSKFEVDQTTTIDGDGIDVNITSVGVDLEDDRTDADDGDEDE